MKRIVKLLVCVFLSLWGLVPAKAQLADSERDFSGVQGQGGWSYGYRDASGNAAGSSYNPASGFTPFLPAHWDGSSWDYGSIPWTWISSTESHPNGENSGPVHWAIRRWTATPAVVPVTTKLPIRCSFQASNGISSNGMTVGVYINGIPKRRVTIGTGDLSPREFVLEEFISPGDVVDCVHEPYGPDGSSNDNSDSAFTKMVVGAKPRTFALCVGVNWPWKTWMRNTSATPQGARCELSYDVSNEVQVHRVKVNPDKLPNGIYGIFIDGAERGSFVIDGSLIPVTAVVDIEVMVASFLGKPIEIRQGGQKLFYQTFAYPLLGIRSAKKVAMAFSLFVGVENVEVLRLESTDFDNGKKLLNSIDELFRGSPRYPVPLTAGDTLVFYIGTHGGYEDYDAPIIVTNLPGNERAVDAQYNANNQALTKPSRANEFLSVRPKGARVTDDLLRIAFSALNPTADSVNKLFLINACFGGGFIGTVNGTEEKGDLSTLLNTAVGASSKEGNYSYFDSSTDAELFYAKAVFEALKGLSQQGVTELNYQQFKLAVQAKDSVWEGRLGRICSLTDDWGAEIMTGPQETMWHKGDDFHWNSGDTPVSPFSVTSPKSSITRISAGNGMVLKAGGIPANHDGFSELAWSRHSGPGVIMFDDTSSLTNGARFSAPGEYVIRLTAATDTTSQNFDVTVRYGMPPAGPPGIIGQHPVAPTATSSNTGNPALQAWVVSAGGGGLATTGTEDGAFLHGKLLAGDFDVFAGVSNSGNISNPGGSPECRFGLMARAADAISNPSAKSAAALMTVGRKPEARFRAVAGAAAVTTPGPILPADMSYLFCRLKRTGNSYSVYYADANQVWQQVGASQVLDLGEAPFVGLVATSAVPLQPATVSFFLAGMQLPAFVGPPEAGPADGPLVNAGPDLTGGGPFQLQGTAALAGSGPNAGILTTRWERRDDFGQTVEIVDPSALNSAFTLDTPGTYTLRLTASNGSVTTFDEMQVTNTRSPITEWRAATFGTQVSDPLVSGDYADPDLDGLSNLVEYAMGTNALGGDTANLRGTPTKLSYSRRTSATDVSLIAERSVDMQSWVAVDGIESLESTSAGISEYNMYMPLLFEEGRSFYRIRVERTTIPGGP